MPIKRKTEQPAKAGAQLKRLVMRSALLKNFLLKDRHGIHNIWSRRKG